VAGLSRHTTHKCCCRSPFVVEETCGGARARDSIATTLLRAPCAGLERPLKAAAVVVVVAAVVVAGVVVIVVVTVGGSMDVAEVDSPK